ncbi:unnamed protein product [Ectocarpus sp. 6 AP-2014]
MARLVDPWAAAAMRLREFGTEFALLPNVTCSRVGLTHTCETCLGSIKLLLVRDFFFSRGLGSFSQPRSPQMRSSWAVLGSVSLDILLGYFALFWH